MYAGKQPLLVLNQNCRCTVIQVTDQLNAAGYSIVRSFDLFSTLASYSKCTCQMIILLVYDKDGPPSTLIFDGNDFSTSVFLENDPERSSRSRFIALLSQLPALNQSLEKHPDEEIDIGRDFPTLPHEN